MNRPAQPPAPRQELGEGNVLVLPAWQLDPAASGWSTEALRLVKAEQAVPVRVDIDLSLRPKVIDACGLTCTFCHNEGTPVAVDAIAATPVSLNKTRKGSGRVSVFAATNGVDFIPGRMEPDERFRGALRLLNTELGLHEMHMTGGEPSLHPQLPKLIEIATEEGFNVRMTSNGERGAQSMEDFAAAGLEKINFSIFGTTPAELAAVQHERYRDEGLAAKKMEALHASIQAALEVGVEAHANIVMPDSSHAERIRRLIEEFEQRLVVRVLPDLDRGEETYRGIYELFASLGAVPLDALVEAGSSNARVKYQLPNGRSVFFKQIRPTRLDTCGDCNFNNGSDCKEGYYGTRLYIDRAGEYKVGVCLQRMDLTMPVEDFTRSSLKDEVIKLREQEYKALSEHYGNSN